MSDASTADPTIDLKKRARRRLVGAATLALLAVIVLPMVMDSEPKPSGQEIQIRIPSQDSDSFSAHMISTNPVATPLPKDQAMPTPVAVAEEPVPAAVDATVKSTTPPVTNLVTETKAETANKSEVAHAEAALEGKDAEQWVVRLGAYQNDTNVKQLASKLKAMNLQSHTEKIVLPQGSRTRVLAGPFKSREAADKARLRIKKIGVDGLVVQQ